MDMIDKAELHLVYKQIKAEPETWDQTKWAVDWGVLGRNAFIEMEAPRCGTAYCFAGHVVLRAGYQVVWDCTGLATTCINPQSGETQFINNTAREVLGLDIKQAAMLFDPANTLPMLRNCVEKLTGEDPDA